MKIMHLADVHLGSRMDSRFDRNISEMMKQQLRSSFQRAVRYAQENGVQIVLLCGDIFDSNVPFKKDKEFFYGAIKSAPEVEFLYLKGNHDLCGDSYDSLPNLKTFSDVWTAYRYGNAVVSGIEISSDNCDAMYSSLQLGKDDFNIVMLHGQAGDSSGANCVNLKKLRNKNIDYLALGHVHKPYGGRLDERGEYFYCGCLCGRGFDEIGERGFILIDTDLKRYEFVPFAECVIHEINVDITDADGSFAAYTKIKEAANLEKKDIYRINLTGEVDAGVDIDCADISAYLKVDCAYSDVKNLSRLKLDIGKLENDRTLKGEFVRVVMQDENVDDLTKKKIISLGLKALNGGDIE